MAENKKFYTTLNIYKNVPNESKGNTFNLIIADGVLRQIAPKQNPNDGSWSLNASLPIQNRAKTINAALGTSFPESQETIWLNIKFSNSCATRMDKLRQHRDYFGVHYVIGSVSANTAENGKTYLNAFVTEFKPDFALTERLDEKKQQGGGAAAPAPANNGGYAPAPVNNGGYAPAPANNGGYAPAPANNGGYAPNNGGGYAPNNGGYSYQPPQQHSVAQTGDFAELSDDDGELPF